MRVVSLGDISHVDRHIDKSDCIRVGLGVGHKNAKKIISLPGERSMCMKSKESQGIKWGSDIPMVGNVHHGGNGLTCCEQCCPQPPCQPVTLCLPQRHRINMQSTMSM